jgi:trimethylamine---corrinoid protein Co-methyltransferase
MDFKMRILTEPDIERIEAQALQVISQIGVRVYDSDLCCLVRRRGISIDADQTVHFPPEAVRWALQVAPRDVSLYGLNGDVLPLRRGHCHLSTYAEAISVSDYGASGLRTSKTQDVVNFVRLGQAMPEINIVNNVCYARDLPDPLISLHTIASVIRHSNKHHNCAALNLDEARLWAELQEIAAPGVDLAKQPSLSFVVSTTSPLQLDRDTASVLSFVAQKKFPFIAASCPMAGATSPLALISTIVQHLAEDLFLLTLAQFINEGTPVVLGGAAGILDMRTGSLSYGAAERHILLGAIIELAYHYGLPHNSPAGSVDAWYPDAQVGAEKMQCWLSRQACDVMWGICFGSLYNGAAVSLEQMVIDADLWQQAKRLFRGLDTAELDNSFTVIQDVGPGGKYLTSDQTVRLMRGQELYYSKIANREGDRGPAMLARAHARVERILSEPGWTPSEAVAQEIDRYVEEKSKELLAKANA